MARKTARKDAVSRFSAGTDIASSRRRMASDAASHTADEPGLTEVDQEIIEALTGFRDALRDRTPLEKKYTVRQVVVVVPPPDLRPEDVRKTREALGVSQPVFADFLGTSTSTVRSWEQGQKVPSPMARRILGLIGSDPTYWKSRFAAMVEPRGSEHEPSVVAGDRSRVPGAQPS
jgi:putative transcriptional regulator